MKVRRTQAELLRNLGRQGRLRATADRTRFIASRFSPLQLLPWHRSDWLAQFHAKACVGVTLPNAGRQPPNHQAHSSDFCSSAHDHGF